VAKTKPARKVGWECPSSSLRIPRALAGASHGIPVLALAVCAPAAPGTQCCELVPQLRAIKWKKTTTTETQTATRTNFKEVENNDRRSRNSLSRG
jgi:hypothetical protein